MSKFIMLLLCMNAIYGLSFAQKKYELKGKVIDENNQALAGTYVMLYPIEKGSVVDKTGSFLIKDVEEGTYKIEISFIGYQTVTDSISIPEDQPYNAALKKSFLNLQEIVVTDNYAERRKREESLNTEIVNERYLRQNLGGSLMKSLERLPGVTTIDIGSGQSKPVIRGLAFNRVVVAENGIKHEAQQWGADHGLEMDQFAISDVEIIKGPASILYGSDAIGGVINIKHRKLPADNSIAGTVNLSGKTNNDYLGTSVSLFGRRKWFFADFRVTLLDYGDYKVPADSVDIYSYRAAIHKNHLRNTAGGEKNLHFSFGIVKTAFQSRFYLSNVSSKSGFFANAHGLEPRNVDTNLHDKSARDINYPYQQVNHFKLINRSRYQWDKVSLETDLGFQRNFRQEWSKYVSHGYMPAIFPGTLNFDPDLERQFEKFVYSGNVRLSYHANEKTHFIIGASGDLQDNKIGGRGFIIPAYKQWSFGSYAFSKHTFSEKSIIQMGIRYDHGTIHTNEYSDWFTSPVIINTDTTFHYLKRAGNISRSFSNFSWSVGYNYNQERWSFKTNVGKSFRIPIAKELAANGVNYHNFSYEVGNPDLSPETSWQFDAGVEFNAPKFAVETTPFLNYFPNYIFLNPSSEHDRLYGNGNQVFYYTQSKVLRLGAEIHAHYEILNALQLGVIGEFVYSEQLSGEKKGFTLPFSPPASAIFNIKYKKPKMYFLENPYLTVDFRITAAQKNIVPPEKTTNGYHVINIGLGGDVKLQNQKVNISLQVQNLTNNKYFNHTSYYRLINVPEPGRNIIANISIPFSGKMNKK
ncbi:iron complex outermembrane recepter protein [Mariniphaga anaerophila]|uniref:Iron complex outermembrane recepter protein n=1 Tax=Mariniphaga anaerophila TaxID=1484053 RepID=A0A1M5FE16_9BACT|nr:TonB-dependent receptor [Mariniphaga anaerophila]SHF89668.1 iron complex outermembrane recepter protein [Mariniphaga anaerophila]